MAAHISNLLPMCKYIVMFSNHNITIKSLLNIQKLKFREDPQVPPIILVLTSIKGTWLKNH